MSVTTRDDDKPVHTFVNPYPELNAGLWSLFLGATVFLGLRVWVKVTRRHGLWYDDYILIVCWFILLANNSLIVWEFNNGYVLKNSSLSWDDHMHILINISSCGTLLGQAWTKSAFGVTLLRMSNQWQQYVLWFCIITMNIWMVLKIIFQWAKVCGNDNYQDWYRLDFCIGMTFRTDFKEGGNVYNIIMDFIFACFPWLITRSLEMRRVEKVGLCLTMSLGMVVAIVSAIRVSWKDEGNERDKYYIWRNGLSQVWYSSEITGTIMVQCIPILRPILRDFHTSLTSRKLGSTTGDGRSNPWSASFSRDRASTNFNGPSIDASDRLELGRIPEESSSADQATTSNSGNNNNNHQQQQQSRGAPPALPPVPQSPLQAMPEVRYSNMMPRNDSWTQWNTDSSRSGKSLDADQDRASHSSNGFDYEQPPTSPDQGLSPPPRRPGVGSGLCPTGGGGGRIGGDK